MGGAYVPGPWAAADPAAPRPGAWEGRASGTARRSTTSAADEATKQSVKRRGLEETQHRYTWNPPAGAEEVSDRHLQPREKDAEGAAGPGRSPTGRGQPYSGPSSTQQAERKGRRHCPLPAAHFLSGNPSLQTSTFTVI